MSRADHRALPAERDAPREALAAAARWAAVLASVGCLLRFTVRHRGLVRAALMSWEALDGRATHADVAAHCGAVALAWGAEPDDVIRYAYRAPDRSACPKEETRPAGV